MMEQIYMNKLDTSTEIDIKRSTFISYIARTETEDDAKEFINTIKEKHRDATHNCSAYIIGENALIQRADDDGEPQGTAGIPILEVLKREELYNTTVVVTRYFGGIKLGAGGLIRAYSSGAAEAVKASGKVYLVPMIPAKVLLDYTFTNRFEYFLEQENIEIRDQQYTDKVSYDLIIPEEKVESVESELQKITRDTFTMTTSEVEMAESTLVKRDIYINIRLTNRKIGRRFVPIKSVASTIMTTDNISSKQMSTAPVIVDKYKITDAIANNAAIKYSKITL